MASLCRQLRRHQPESLYRRRLVAQKAVEPVRLGGQCRWDTTSGPDPWYAENYPNYDDSSGVIDSVRLYNYALTPRRSTHWRPRARIPAPPRRRASPARRTTPSLRGTSRSPRTAADTDSAISEVAFYAGTTLLGTATSSPYSYTWSNPTPGAYQLTAIAYSNGLCVMSAPVSITVLGPPQSPWSTADIGSVGITGNAGESTNGTLFEATGAGGGDALQTRMRSAICINRSAATARLSPMWTTLQDIGHAWGDAGVDDARDVRTPAHVNAYIGINSSMAYDRAPPAPAREEAPHEHVNNHYSPHTG